MAELQTSNESGEMAQRFIELVIMQAQNAAYAMGQIPHPETGEAPVNLELARLFIDQLVVLRTKTKGNLGPDEQGVLNNAISNLQMVFVEVSQGAASPATPEAESEVEPPAPAEEDEPVAEAAAPAAEPAPAPAPAGEESKKKFSKSYGA